MHRLNVWLTVKDPAHADEIAELLREAGRLSRQEAGCVRFDVYRSTAQPDRFLLCEWWESQAAWEAHREAQAFTTIYQPQVLPRVEREPHPCELLE